LHRNEAPEASIDGVPVEVVFDVGRRFWLLDGSGRDVGRWVGRSLRLEAESCPITGAGFKDAVAHPWRVLLTSPDLFLAVVPATDAIELTQSIYAQWRKRFGKIWGRLPLAVAHLFFPAHLPMFSVLDAARRVERGFRNIQRSAGAAIAFTGPASPDDVRLGTGEIDFHHPYLVLDETDGTCDFESPCGRLIHMTRACGRRVRIHPDLYFASWLGSSAARFEVETSAGLEDPDSKVRPIAEYLARTRPAPGRGLPAIQLEHLDDRVAGFWEALRRHRVSDTEMRGIAQVYLSKAEAWTKQDPERRAARILALAVASDLPEGLRSELADRMADRTFERTLELYWHILKKKLQDEKGDRKYVGQLS
jgi:hypothetical protein